MKFYLFLFLVFMSVPQQEITIYNSSNTDSINNWMVVDDGVMGGLSQGNISLSDEGHAVFSGFVTTENNGGFSSIRYAFKEFDVNDHTYLVLRVKGDGSKYQCRLKDDYYQRYTYVSSFETTGEWQTIKLPLAEFYPYFRGYVLDMPNFPKKTLAQIGILIGNKRKEKFHLEIESISLQ
ncbi:MAG: CIA30 family protein [bacterium]